MGFPILVFCFLYRLVIKQVIQNIAIKIQAEITLLKPLSFDWPRQSDTKARCVDSICRLFRLQLRCRLQVATAHPHPHPLPGSIYTKPLAAPAGPHGCPGDLWCKSKGEKDDNTREEAHLNVPTITPITCHKHSSHILQCRLLSRWPATQPWHNERQFR